MSVATPNASQVAAALTLIPVPRPDIKDLTLEQAEAALDEWRGRVKKKYRALAKKLHPDHADRGDPTAVERATEQFKALNAAHEILQGVKICRKADLDAKKAEATKAATPRPTPPPPPAASRVRWSPPPPAWNTAMPSRVEVAVVTSLMLGCTGRGSGGGIVLPSGRGLSPILPNGRVIVNGGFGGFGRGGGRCW